ncbi:hypothetical protein DO021_19720 [Desulfobacter hydrogenophilus]|uniref:Sulfatase-modifying factor enzyme domain-containing protein n=1 Tax=Desulfobacter hydrogenophilus TaxID=2291 RepID=A0A328FB37_9BACT|nr:hypothetical protein EYB58_16320 [Desulfobacter hydrogenophilus]RAM00345.1 hypothetical protein DO021_19720 [Desulfobacter hydrogenophilus]
MVPLRGGNWNNTSNAGLGNLNLNNVRSNVSTYLGFFPALLYVRCCLAMAGQSAQREKEASVLPERENIYLARRRVSAY